MSFWGKTRRHATARPTRLPIKSEPGRACPQCGSLEVKLRVCSAIGQVVGVGRHVPLIVELLRCEHCEHTEFTGEWSIDWKAHEDRRR